MCFCSIDNDFCPTEVVAGEPFFVTFTVNVSAACDNCNVRCVTAPDNVDSTCELSVNDGPFMTGNVPVGPGESTVTARVVFDECPTGNITVNVRVACFDEFDEETCEDSAVCVIRSCTTPNAG